MNRALPLLMLMWVGCVAPNRPIQEPTTLRVMSYNIKHGYGMDGKIDFERIAAVIRKQNPDVVTLQEVDKAVSRSGGIDTAQHLGQLLGMTHHFAKFMDYQGGEYGLAGLSSSIARWCRAALRPRSRGKCGRKGPFGVGGCGA